MSAVSAFLDGDDLCAGCGICCHDITGLRVADAELERVPLLAPYVVGREGVFNLLSVPGACPYLRADGRCGTFATRPFDCSLYPVHVSEVGLRQLDGSVRARWMYTASECPERPEFLALARRKGTAGVAAWVGEVTGAERVVLRPDRSSQLRALLTITLHRVRLLAAARRLLGRPPLPTKPSPPR